MLITLAGAFYFRTALGRSDEGHIFYGSLFALLIAIIAVDRLLTASLEFLSARKVIGLPLLLATATAGAGLIWFCNAAYHPLPALKTRLSRELPRSVASEIPPEQEALIRSVSGYIRTHTLPNEPVFDFSDQLGERARVNNP